MTGFRGQREVRRVEFIVVLFELALLGALLILLAIAAGKLYALLGRMDYPAWKRLPIGLVFVAAAALTAHRASARVRGLRRRTDDDTR